MHHKKRKQKNARAGCKMCKPHKGNGYRGIKLRELSKRGFGNLRAERVARHDLKEPA